MHDRILQKILAILLLLGAIQPQTFHYQVDSSSSDVSANVAFFGLARKSATFPTVTGKLSLSPENTERVELDVVINARKLQAGDPVTLERLRGPKFFDVEHHPVIRFTGNSIKMTGPRSARVAGTLTARGISHPETLLVAFDQDPFQTSGKSPIGISGTMTIDRREYGMTAYALIVGRKVDIRIRTRMIPA